MFHKIIRNCGVGNLIPALCTFPIAYFHVLYPLNISQKVDNIKKKNEEKLPIKPMHLIERDRMKV